MADPDDAADADATADVISCIEEFLHFNGCFATLAVRGSPPALALPGLFLLFQKLTCLRDLRVLGQLSPSNGGRQR